VVLYLAGGGSPDPLASVYVWDDALDHPGSILAVRDSLPLELVEQWPEFGRYEVAIGPVPVEGRFWVGCRSVYQDVRDWYVAIDTDGGEGCRLLNFPPGYGFPTGWNDVGICWSSARALGIGALFSSAASGALEGTGVLPTRLALGLPTPNPSCGSVSVELDLPRRCAVRVQVFDVAGKLVQTLMAEDPPPGRHLLCWDGSSIGGLESPAGTYLIRLKAGNSTQVRKAMLIR